MAAAQSFLYLSVIISLSIVTWASSERSFSIDYTHDTFVRDGKPFRYISGSLHYFRVPYQYWEDRLKKMAAAGLNAVQILIAWNVHEPSPGVYNFSGQQNISNFLTIAQSYNLSVIVRGGPYICGEWEYGGLPAWLLTDNPDMKVRTSDPSYIKRVDTWMDKLYSVLKPHLYKNGGNIITLAIENEYGSFYACDYDYIRFLRKKAIDSVGDDVVLFTVDGDGEFYLRCGTLEGLYTTVDFGPTMNPKMNFDIQREWQPQGPLVNSEYYTGWLDHWGNNHSMTPTKTVAYSLELMLELGANVNMYMFEGGTNFGFWNGANFPYQPVPTSYDYDAPLTEAGDITDKYMALRKIISKYNPPTIDVPPSTLKFAYGKVQMKLWSTVYEYVTTGTKPVESLYPLTMEQIEHYYGFILYTHKLSSDVVNKTLNVSAIRDRGYIWLTSGPFMYLDTLTGLGKECRPMSSLIMVYTVRHWEVPVGIVDRIGNTTIQLTAKKEQNLCILVENQGRINFGTQMDYNTKGLISNVTLEDSILTNWQQYPVIVPDEGPFWNQSRLHSRLVSSSKEEIIAPSIYGGTFMIGRAPEDTYLDMSQWTKGQLLVNGHNLGRYWPKKGPQVRLYVPKFYLKTGLNEVIMIELENAPCNTPVNCTVAFMDHPLINSTVIPNGNFHVPEILTEYDRHRYH